MPGPAIYSRDTDVASAARELLDDAAVSLDAMTAGQRAAIGALLRLWPHAAWRAAGCVSATSWSMAYAGLSYPEAHRLEKITGLCAMDDRIAEAVLSGELSLGRAWVLARAVTEERARFLTDQLVDRLLSINSEHPDDDDWNAAVNWWRELVDQELGPARAQRQSLVVAQSLFGGGEIHAHLLPSALANVIAGLDAFMQNPDPKDAPYQRTHSERRADALDDMAAFARTHDCDDDDGVCPDAEDEELRAEDTFDGLDREWDDLDEREAQSEELSEEQAEDLDLLDIFRRRLRRKINQNRRRASRRVRARSGTRATIHIDLRTMAALRGIDDLEGLVLRGEGFGLVYAAAEEMLCDSTLVATLFSSSGKVLDTTDDTEQWSKRQRRAIAARDKCCVFPGCTRPPKHCDVHHLQHREHDGPTTTENGALLCRFHHRLLHQFRWRLRQDDDGTWVATDPHDVEWRGRRTTPPAAA